MQNFLVLGYIPGTQIQINFTSWLIAFLLFVGITYVSLRREQIRYRITAMRLAHYIRQQQVLL